MRSTIDSALFTPDDSAGTPRLFKGIPSWMVSAFVHLVLLLVLAWQTLGFPEEDNKMSIASQAPPESADELDPTEFEVTPVELDVAEMDAVSIPDPGAMDIGDLGLAADFSEVTQGVGELEDTTLGDIGELFGDEGVGMQEIGAGNGAAMFFGVKTSGNRFCFVVDNSNSMNSGKFETACFELTKSVRQLTSSQYFYVIFYSDTAYPLFYPKSATGFVRATDENKRKLEYWLFTVHRCLRTNGEEAMARAFSLRPDVIYLLGDGAFGDKTVDKTLATDNNAVTIHTLGFKMNEKNAEGFIQIAEKFKGKFTDVAVTPAMVEVSKRMNRPKNNTRNGVWGIKLGQRKKKKK